MVGGFLKTLRSRRYGLELEGKIGFSEDEEGSIKTAIAGHREGERECVCVGRWMYIVK